MTKREVVRAALEHRHPPYVPWSFGFTQEARQTLVSHLGTDDLQPVLQNHFLGLGSGVGLFKGVGNGRVEDVFGVVWNRSVDKDIGIVEGCVLPEPSLEGYVFPDPTDPMFFEGVDERLERFGDLWRVFSIGFSLFERAWTLRGMENLLMDFVENPAFVHELFNAIADYNIAQVRHAMTFDIDCVHFGDDWGQQHGLIMGPRHWREFIKPVLSRMYAVVKEKGLFVSIHSCGDVDEVFDDLVAIGLDCFNPFQPEVMDVDALMEQYRGRLAFHGGLSTQRTLPYGSVGEVRQEVRHLVDLGSDGGYVFSPAHAVEGDVPLENMLAFIEQIQSQRGYDGPRLVDAPA